jgi:Holliday junction resolvase
MNRDKEKGNSSYRRSRKQEREIAERLGGRRTAASGSKDEKGDVRVKGVVRIEAKTTKHKSFSVTLDMIRQIEDAALVSGEMPVIAIEFNDGKGKRLKEVAVVPIYVLDLLKGDA